MARIGAVVGLPVERLILSWRCRQAFAGPLRSFIAVAAADARRAEAMADVLVSRGAEALVSFGVAGGLDPAIPAGSLVLANEVAMPDGSRIATDAAWRRRLRASLGDARVVERGIAGVDQPVATRAAKAALAAVTGAVAVDMESHGIARAAFRHQVPLLVLRAVADPAGRALPSSAAAGFGADGKVHAGATLAPLLTAPGEIPALLGLTLELVRALITLWGAAGGLEAEVVR